MSFRIIHGDALTVLRTMEENSVDCCVTSPPYWNLRSYHTEPQIWGGSQDHGHQWIDTSWRANRWGTHDDETFGTKQRTNHGSAGHRGSLNEQQSCSVCGAWLGELGREPDPKMYVAHVMDVFREVRRVIKGTCWVNIGDSWANDTKWGGTTGGKHVKQLHGEPIGRSRVSTGLKGKDLIGIPWMLAFALRDSGWYLRQEIIWEKPAVMPESVKDRPTRSHEQVFLLAKTSRYYYNADAIKEPASPDTHARYARGRSDSHKFADGGPGGQTIARTFEHMRKNGVNPKATDKQGQMGRRHAGFNERWKVKQNESFSAAVKDIVEFRNKRSVWRITNEPNSEEHFAAFPIGLVEPCILAGCPPDGTVLDPFAGLGTVGNACLKHGRNFVGVELNPEYVTMANARLQRHQPLFASDWQGADSEPPSA